MYVCVFVCDSIGSKICVTCETCECMCARFRVIRLRGLCATNPLSLDIESIETPLAHLRTHTLTHLEHTHHNNGALYVLLHRKVLWVVFVCVCVGVSV